MKKLLVALFVLAASMSFAQEAVVSRTDNNENYYYNKPVPVIEGMCVDVATSTDASKTITGSASVSIGTIPTGTRRILVRALTVDVNWDLDSTVGSGHLFQIPKDGYMTFVGDSTELAKLYFQSEEAATSATLLVRYFER